MRPPRLEAQPDDERGYRDAKMRVGVWVSLAWIPFGLLYPIMPTVYLAIAFMIPPAFSSVR